MPSAADSARAAPARRRRRGGGTAPRRRPSAGASPRGPAGSRRRAGGRRASGSPRRAAVERRLDASRRSRRRAPGATAPSVEADATTWARNHVGPESMPRTRGRVPKPKKRVSSERDGRPHRAAGPGARRRAATSSAPMTTASSAWSVARPQSATNGSRTSAGSGGNGISPRPVGCPSASTTGIDVVEVVVAGAVGRRRDRVRDRELALEPRLRLPDEMVVEGLVGADGSAEIRARGRRATRPRPTASAVRARGVAAATRAAPGIGRRALGYTPVHLSARSRRPSKTVPGPAAGETRAGRRAGPGSHAGRHRPARRPPRARPRPPTHHRIRPAARLRVQGRPRRASAAGRWSSPGTDRGGFYDRAIFVDYTPGLPLRPVGARARRARRSPSPIGELLKLPAIARRPRPRAGRLRRWPPTSGASRRRALAAAGVVLLVPVTWFDSAVWAQVDSVGTLVLLLAVRELWRGRSERRRDPHDGRGDHQAPVRDPDPARRGRHHPPPLGGAAGRRRAGSGGGPVRLAHHDDRRAPSPRPRLPAVRPRDRRRLPFGWAIPWRAACSARSSRPPAATRMLT